MGSSPEEDGLELDLVSPWEEVDSWRLSTLLTTAVPTGRMGGRLLAVPGMLAVDCAIESLARQAVYSVVFSGEFGRRPPTCHPGRSQPCVPCVLSVYSPP